MSSSFEESGKAGSPQIEKRPALVRLLAAESVQAIFSSLNLPEDWRAQSDPRLMLLDGSTMAFGLRANPTLGDAEGLLDALVSRSDIDAHVARGRLVTRMSGLHVRPTHNNLFNILQLRTPATMMHSHTPENNSSWTGDQTETTQLIGELLAADELAHPAGIGTIDPRIKKIRFSRPEKILLHISLARSEGPGALPTLDSLVHNRALVPSGVILEKLSIYPPPAT